MIDSSADDEKPGVHVFAIEKLDSYYSCVKFNGKVIPTDDDISECPKCDTMQVTTECRDVIVVQLQLMTLVQ